MVGTALHLIIVLGVYLEWRRATRTLTRHTKAIRTWSATAVVHTWPEVELIVVHDIEVGVALREDRSNVIDLDLRTHGVRSSNGSISERCMYATPRGDWLIVQPSIMQHLSASTVVRHIVHHLRTHLIRIDLEAESNRSLVVSAIVPVRVIQNHLSTVSDSQVECLRHRQTCSACGFASRSITREDVGRIDPVIVVFVETLKSVNLGRNQGC